MVSIKEYIRHEEGNGEAWVCVCGNRPDSDGFFPCEKDVNEMTPAEGWDNLYVCGRCGRIIDQSSLEVVDQNPNFKRLE
jgi:hypothetical protein